MESANFPKKKKSVPVWKPNGGGTIQTENSTPEEKKKGVKKREKKAKELGAQVVMS
jgi:hypothetical protein